MLSNFEERTDVAWSAGVEACCCRSSNSRRVDGNVGRCGQHQHNAWGEQSDTQVNHLGVQAQAGEGMITTKKTRGLRGIADELAKRVRGGLKVGTCEQHAKASQEEDAGSCGVAIVASSASAVPS